MFCVPTDSSLSRHLLAVSCHEPDAGSPPPTPGAIGPGAQRHWESCPRAADRSGPLIPSKKKLGSPKTPLSHPVPTCVSSGQQAALLSDRVVLAAITSKRCFSPRPVPHRLTWRNGPGVRFTPGLPGSPRGPGHSSASPPAPRAVRQPLPGPSATPASFGTLSPRRAVHAPLWWRRSDRVAVAWPHAEVALEAVLGPALACFCLIPRLGLITLASAVP